MKDKFDMLLADERRCEHIIRTLNNMNFKINYIKEARESMDNHLRHIRAQRRIIIELRDKILDYPMEMFN